MNWSLIDISKIQYIAFHPFVKKHEVCWQTKDPLGYDVYFKTFIDINDFKIVWPRYIQHNAYCGA